MTNPGPIEFARMQSANLPTEDDFKQQAETEGVDPSQLPPDFVEQAKKYGLIKSDSGVKVAETLPPPNPYVPTGWRKRQTVEFDLTLPSGQTCRARRLERNDVIKLKIVDQLDTLLPLLIDLPEGPERDEKIKQVMKDDPSAIEGMFGVIDIVVMACCLKPAVTANEAAVNYGTPLEWGDPTFVPIAYIDDIEPEDKVAIFAAAFGADMSDLKSAGSATPSVAHLPASQSVQLPTQ